jgi:cytochrome c-type biogenesis protein CcmH
MRTSLRTLLLSFTLSLSLSFVLLAPCVYAIDSVSFDDPVLQSRYLKLTHELRCLQCQNESIADSNATLAGDLRREVREMLSSGKSDDEILKFLTDRYGDFVLYKPPMSARTLIIWFAPGIFLAGGLAWVVVVIQRRATQPLDKSDANDVGEVNEDIK